MGYLKDGITCNCVLCICRSLYNNYIFYDFTAPILIYLGSETKQERGINGEHWVP